MDKIERRMLVGVLEGYTSEIAELREKLTNALNYVADMRDERDDALAEVERLKAKLNEYVSGGNSGDTAHSDTRLGDA